jgi:hypothetical protein
MAKANQWSVTEEPSRCGYLQRQAADPGLPIVFDEVTGEYQIEYLRPDNGEGRRRKGHLIIYHCPWCGGAAPPSRRDLLFAVITDDERNRLLRLLDGITTVDGVIQALGTADLDLPHGLISSQEESEGQPPTTASYRTLTYTRLSDAADVVITDYRHKGLDIILQGKYIGPPTGE